MPKMKVNGVAILELRFEHKKTGDESKLRLAVNDMEHAKELMSYHKRSKKKRLISASVTLTYFED